MVDVLWFLTCAFVGFSISFGWFGWRRFRRLEARVTRLEVEVYALTNEVRAKGDA